MPSRQVREIPSAGSMTGAGRNGPVAAGRRQAAWVSMTVGNLGLLVAIGQGLVLVPLYLRFIGVRLYGSWLGSSGLISWLAGLDFGISGLMVQRMSSAYGRGDARGVAAYFSSGVLVQVSAAALMIGVAAAIRSGVPGWMGVGRGESRTFALCFLAAVVARALETADNAVSGLSFALQLPTFSAVARIFGTLLGFGVSATLLLDGDRLWAIAAGLLARNGSLLIADAVYAFYLLRVRVGVGIHLDRSTIADFVRLTPPMLVGSMANAFGGKSEPALIAMIMKPELVAVFSLTRRAGELAAMVLDRISGAVFPGFTHLYAEGDQTRAAGVLAEVLTGYAATATLMLGAFAAFNRSFLRLWVGEAQFGGITLTLLMASAIFLSTRNRLVSYLYGATGEIARGAMVTTAETVARVALMVPLLVWLGLEGPPLAALATGIVLSGVLSRLMGEKLRREWPRAWPPVQVGRVVGYAVVVGLGVVVGLVVNAGTWAGLVLLCGGYLLVGSSILFVCDRQMRTLSVAFARWVLTPILGMP